jgi:hypothetical protein
VTFTVKLNLNWAAGLRILFFKLAVPVSLVFVDRLLLLREKDVGVGGGGCFYLWGVIFIPKQTVLCYFIKMLGTKVQLDGVARVFYQGCVNAGKQCYLGGLIWGSFSLCFSFPC